MQVDHGGGDVGVAKESSNRPDVRSRFEKLSGERMMHRVRSDAFGDAGFAHGIADLGGRGVIVEMVAGGFMAARVWGLGRIRRLG